MKYAQTFGNSFTVEVDVPEGTPKKEIARLLKKEAQKQPWPMAPVSELSPPWRRDKQPTPKRAK